MRITKVRSFIVGAFRCNWIFVKIYTDGGVDGVGEATLEFNEQGVLAMLEQIGELLVGKDPFQIEAHRDTIIRDNYWRTNVVLRAALSGIEGALFDLKGKALGVPVYDLLGGKRRDRIPVYANTWRPFTDEPEKIAARAGEIVASGFRAVKFDPFFPADLHMLARDRQKAIEMLRSVREAIGPDNDLLVEGHGRFDVHTAIMIAHEMAPTRPYWFEEPIAPESINALADVRRHSPVPIATGERTYDLFHVADLLRQDAVDVLQPDICHIGGIGELMRMALTAHAYLRPVAPHNVNGPVGNAMTLHAAAALPNVNILETCSVDAPWRQEVTSESVEIVDGQMLVPDRPGLGIELNETALSLYPAKHFGFHHYAPPQGRVRSPGAVPWYRMSQND